MELWDDLPISEHNSFFVTPQYQFESIEYNFQRGWYNTYIEYVYVPGEGLTPVRRPYQQ